MILQSLVHHYEYLFRKEELPQAGWSFVKISYVLCINDDGELEQVVCLDQATDGKKKTKVVLPAQAERSNNINPSFLADNSAYMLGIEKKKEVTTKSLKTFASSKELQEKLPADVKCPDARAVSLGVEKKGEVTTKSLKTFASSKELHEKLLADVKCPAAQAVLAFFQKWDPRTFASHPALEKIDPKFFGEGNMVFRYKGQYLHDIPEIRQAWQIFYNNPIDTPKGLCLVTGERDYLALTHPCIKGIVNSAPSGAKLVSFNNEISWSDGHVGGWNAPISRYAAFAYTEALNYMLADKEHSFVLGDVSVVCWAKDGGADLQDSFLAALRGEALSYSTAEIQDVAGNLCKAKYVPFDESKLDKNCEFYVLGLSCSKTRASVRFFYRNTFGHLLENVKKHRERLTIDAPDFEDPVKMSLWRLLKETKPRSKKKAGEKKEKPTNEDYTLYNDVIKSILENRNYPEQLFSAILARISADMTVSPGRAAILKAYFLKASHHDVPESVLGEFLNENCENVPYNLGRMFSVLETIQWYYNPDTKDTIKNSSFYGASTSPAYAYPKLLELSEHHLKGLSEKKQYWLRGLLSEIKKKVGKEYPVTLNVQQQAVFYLGYYQQVQRRYQKKREYNKDEEKF